MPALTQARLEELLDELPTAAGCVFCPTERFEGTARECREWSQAHRQQHHPELATIRYRRRKARRRFNTANLTVQQEEQLTVDRLRRMRLLGIPG